MRLAPEGLAAPESGSITSIRHEALLRESLEALENARRAVEFGIPHEMLLLDLYAALRPDRRRYRSDHRGRYPEPDLLHLLHRKVSLVTSPQCLNMPSGITFVFY